MSKWVSFLTLSALLVSLTLAVADDLKTGAIAGRLTDKETGQPVVGASVLVVGTKFGAMTDPDGKYLVSRLAPGKYVLRFSSVDYSTVDVSAVEVKAGLTTEINHRLVKKVTDIDVKITCIATQNPNQKFETSNQVAITSQTLQKKPVQTVDYLLQNVQGVQTTAYGQVFVRGGRAGEVAYCSPPDATQVPLSHGGTTTVNNVSYEAMFFKDYGVNPFIDVEDDSLSTFAVDVDDASYIMARSYLDSNSLPPAEAVRAEEFVNHFTYEYPSPRREPFSIELEGAPSEFGNANNWLLRVGIQGRYVTAAERKPANLVFVIDISGSMEWGNRLELVKKALHLLVDELRPDDRAGIVVYGSTARVHLDPRSVSEGDELHRAIDRLHCDGATNAEAGIRIGYHMADRMFDPRKTNRIILCSDGVANVGTTGPDQVLEQIRRYAKKGITLTTVGFGMGNYNDILMEKLGDKGNGHYAYVDDIDEAKRVFIDNLTGTLQVIARDVKIQVAYDSAMVRSYRLIGYENRDVADGDFRNDTLDGGEIGSGHCVTALYELKLNQRLGSGTLGRVQVRFKDAEGKQVREVSRVIDPDYFGPRFDSASFDFRLAAVAAQFSEILRDSYWAKGERLSDLRPIAASLKTEFENSETTELLSLIDRACQMKESLSEK